MHICQMQRSALTNAVSHGRPGPLELPGRLVAAALLLRRAACRIEQGLLDATAADCSDVLALVANERAGEGGGQLPLSLPYPNLTLNLGPGR